MRFIMLVLAAAFLLPALVPGPVRADVDIGVSIGEEGLKGFYFAVGDYFKGPENEGLLLKNGRIASEAMPVAFFIAQRAGVGYSAVIDLRLKGLSWVDISIRLGQGPDIFYVPVKGVKGPPYGKAYGYYAKKGAKTAPLGDDDVVNLVNLKFLSGHYSVEPEVVIELRSGGKDFVNINDDIKKRKKGKGDNDKGNNKGEKGRGKKK